MNKIVNPSSYQNPKISVVIPVYNGSNYLSEAINSVLNQTYKNYEIIVVDDGSTDDTWEVIQSYGDKVRGFKKENGGVSTALNYAIDVMEGEWFAWLSHDDLWLPTKLEEQVHWMEQHPGCGMYYAGSYLMDENYKLYVDYPGKFYPPGKDLRMMIRSNYISGITTLIHKKCFKDTGKFSTEHRCLQDADMWFKIMRDFYVSSQKKSLAISRIHRKQTGVTAKSRCRAESINVRNGWLMTPIEKLYNAKKTNIILKIRKYIYSKYVYFCLEHSIPVYHRVIDRVKSKIESYPMYEDIMR